ncbi:lactonase family protein [Microvirga sp. M2]|uniref:lactonase family protein n=1 Tax=Microvirga sp. M2 TaxID=3073270 RepID=UPI0039C469D6
MSRLRMIAILASTLGLAAVPAGAATFVYVGNAESQDISVLELKAGGDLTPVATIPIPGPAEPGDTTPLAVSPNQRFLYAGLRNEPYSVATFSIDARTGRPTYVGSGPLANSMAYIATDRSGRFLLSASSQGNEVTVSAIGPNSVVEETQQTVPTRPNAHCILADPANRFVLHTSLGGDVIYQEKFDAMSGRLTPNDPPTRSVKAQSGPRHLIFSPNGKFVYLVSELDGSIDVFPYDAAAGILNKEIQIASSLPKGFSGKPWAADIHITPDGRFLYVSERTSSTLAAFRVDPENGTLTSIGSYPTAEQPRAFGIDPSGRYLLAVGQLSNSLESYSIDQANGTLTRLKDYPMGKNPNWVSFISLP